jgi:hypothetical protein
LSLDELVAERRAGRALAPDAAGERAAHREQEDTARSGAARQESGATLSLRAGTAQFGADEGERNSIPHGSPPFAAGRSAS